jgi:ubiquinone/menaquinone biosynthesis C-methylase UbiE
MTVVDYGCGPGRYTAEFAKLVGDKGRVIAVDLLEIALRETEKRLKKQGLTNVDLRLARVYDSGIARGAADIVCAVDMFHHVEPKPFLAEVKRILKPDGHLVISGGHQRRISVKRAVEASGSWELVDEARILLRYKKAK